MTYLSRAVEREVNPKQTDPLNERQVKNNAGGYVFAVDMWTRLDRFLILGSEGATYYASEKKLTSENIGAVKECIAQDGQRTVNRIVEISDSGRAPKNDPALLALAYAASKGDDKTRAAALEALPKVARIGTHLFHFVDFVTKLRGGGRGLRRALANWYLDKPNEKLSEQVVKYQQRDGWSHRDVLRIGRPHTEDKTKNAILRWTVKSDLSKREVIRNVDENPVKSKYPSVEKYLPSLIQGHELLQAAKTEKAAAKLIREYSLVRESVPTEYLKSSVVWEALLENMPITAMIRNLGNMSKCGLLAPLSDASKIVSDRLANQELLRKARVHPIQILISACTYGAGRGMLGSGEWKVVPQIVDALDDAYYLAFSNVMPTQKNFYLGIDVSGSMASGNVAGTFLTPRTASVALAMVTARTEKNYVMRAFSDGASGRKFGKTPSKSMHYGYDTCMVPLEITARTRLQDAVKLTDDLPFGGTDCALPMLDAMQEKLPIDVFIILTDSETWAGNVHPTKALEMYRQKMGRDAKLIVMGMVANEFSIADPKDAGMLDVVGFDANVPNLIADFAKS